MTIKTHSQQPPRRDSLSSSRIIQFDYSALNSVIVGQRAETVVPEIVSQLGAKRVFLIASKTLNRSSDAVSKIVTALGESCVGVFDQIGAHTPRQDVLAAIAEVREARADLLISVGGGSIIDACKVVQLAIDQGLESKQQLLEYAQFSDGSRGSKAGDFSLFKSESKLRQIAIPTTLSGAEFSNNAGVTDTEKSTKEGYRGSDLCPKVIVYDPFISSHTPQWLWLSTAIRSLDHAIEGYCSSDSHTYLDAHFLHAISLFAKSLPEVVAKVAQQGVANCGDSDGRSLNQQAVWLAACGLGKVGHGASHGIGYILGSLCGVPHGYTSCVMLPAVLAFNAQAIGANAIDQDISKRQQAIAKALGCDDATAAQAVKSLVRSLGLPVTLNEVGVKREQFEAIAQRAFKHPVVRNNPKPIHSPQQVLEILELAWQ